MVGFASTELGNSLRIVLALSALGGAVIDLRACAEIVGLQFTITASPTAFVGCQYE